MGQYWKFINVDKRQTTGPGGLGKLGEFFFSSSSIRLLYLISIPTVSVDFSDTYHESRQIPGVWAGDRIICLGDYAEEWPEACVTAADFTNLPAGEEKEEVEGDGDNGQMGILPPSSLYYRSTRVAGPDRVANDAYPNHCVWVLRNLTKKLYVRSNGIPTLGQVEPFAYTAAHGLSGYPGLGHVLLSNIAWSQDPSCSMSCSEDLTRGKWAGDRFDVRVFSDVQESMMEDDWKDVSRENARRLHKIWVEDGNDDSEFQEEPQDEA